LNQQFSAEEREREREREVCNFIILQYKKNIFHI
jgi:hypothetical protein